MTAATSAAAWRLRLLRHVLRDDAALDELGVALAGQLQVLGLAPIARQLRFGLREQRLVARQIGFGLLELRLIRPRIDREEVIALLDEVAFVEQHLGDDAGHLRSHADGLERFDVADRGHFDRHVALLNRGGDDRHGAAVTAAATAAATATAAAAIRGRCRGVGPAARDRWRNK